MLEADGISEDRILSPDTYEEFHDFILRHYEEAAVHFSDSKRAGQEYFREMVGDARRVCAVDIGWNGLIMGAMRKAFREMFGDDVVLKGAYMALVDNPTPSSYVESGFVTPYLFHGCMNRDIAIDHSALGGDMEAKFIEATFTSDQCTLLKYGHTPEGQVDLVYGTKMADDNLVHEIQQGIMDFVDLWQERTVKIRPHIQIMPYDTKKILDCAIKNFRYCYAIFGDNQEWDLALPNFKGQGRLTTMGEMLKQRGLV